MISHHFSLCRGLAQRFQLQVKAAAFLIDVLDVLPEFHNLRTAFSNCIRALVHLLRNSCATRATRGQHSDFPHHSTQRSFRAAAQALYWSRSAVFDTGGTTVHASPRKGCSLQLVSDLLRQPRLVVDLEQPRLGTSTRSPLRHAFLLI